MNLCPEPPLECASLNALPNEPLLVKSPNDETGEAIEEAGTDGSSPIVSIYELRSKGEDGLEECLEVL